MREDSEKAAAAIRARIGATPIDVGLVIGASLAAVGGHIAAPVSLQHAELPGFVRSRFDTDVCECVVGTLGSARVAMLKGRAHYHETGDIAGMRVPLETLKLLGAKSRPER
jgi:purine-nucleoside phosphorylase